MEELLAYAYLLGIYSLNRNCSELEIIGAKYPKAVFTGESAFYYHGLTDVISDFYHLATVRTDGRIKDEWVFVSTVWKKC